MILICTGTFMMIKMVCGLNCKKIIISPCLILPVEKEQPIGVWIAVYKKCRRGTYITLFIRGKLNAYFSDIDNTGAGARGKAYRADETGTGHNGIPKERKFFRMSRTDGQHTDMCEGDCE